MPWFLNPIDNVTCVDFKGNAPAEGMLHANTHDEKAGSERNVAACFAVLCCAVLPLQLQPLAGWSGSCVHLPQHATGD